MSAIFQSFYKTVAATGTPEALGASTVLFNSAIITARKSDDAANTSNVWLQFVATDASSAKELYPGQSELVIAPNKSLYAASNIYVDVTTAGDGVLFQYFRSDWKAWLDIESKLEEAGRKLLLTIAATVDDCSITTGISEDERTAENINVHCASATERLSASRSGVWDCQMTVTVRTVADYDDSGDKLDDSMRANKLAKHRLRTAYARDLFCDPDAPEILSALSDRLHCYTGSVRDMSVENGIEGRQWVSRLTFTITAQTSDLL